EQSTASRLAVGDTADRRSALHLICTAHPPVPLSPRATRFIRHRDATPRSALAAAGEAHWVCADDGLSARRAFEPGRPRAAMGRAPRESRDQHLREPDAVRSERGFLPLPARPET